MQRYSYTIGLKFAPKARKRYLYMHLFLSFFYFSLVVCLTTFKCAARVHLGVLLVWSTCQNQLFLLRGCGVVNSFQESFIEFRKHQANTLVATGRAPHPAASGKATRKSARLPRIVLLVTADGMKPRTQPRFHPNGSGLANLPNLSQTCRCVRLLV